MCLFLTSPSLLHNPWRSPDRQQHRLQREMQHVSPGKQRNRMVCKSPVARTLEPNADFTMMILGNASGIKCLLCIDGRPEPHPPTYLRVAGSLKLDHQLLSFTTVFQT